MGAGSSLTKRDLIMTAWGSNVKNVRILTLQSIVGECIEATRVSSLKVRIAQLLKNCFSFSNDGKKFHLRIRIPWLLYCNHHFKD